MDYRKLDRLDPTENLRSSPGAEDGTTNYQNQGSCPKRKSIVHSKKEGIDQGIVVILCTTPTKMTVSCQYVQDFRRRLL